MKNQNKTFMKVLFVIAALMILGTILSSNEIHAQMPPKIPMPSNGMPPGEKTSSLNIPPNMQDRINMNDNIGNDVSNFIKYAISQFQVQRMKTLDVIQQCREQMTTIDENHRDSIRQECRLKLDEIKNSFSDIRKTFRDTFKEFGSSVRTMMMDARGYGVSDSQRQNAINMINERVQKMNFQERTYVDNLYGQVQQGDSNKISNFEQCVSAGNPILESTPLQCKDANGMTYEESKPPTNNSSWNPQLKVSEQDGFLIIKSNGIPNHEVGDFPNRYNPNTIEEQNYEFKIPLNPQLSGHMTELPMGPIGISLDGAPFFNPYTAQHTDAVVNEVFDDCSGHPTERGAYHYHQLSSCFKDNPSDHSALFGYAFDGFPVYGFNGENGIPPTDLDECNGHVEGNLGYHYHATKEFPYLLGCYSGQSEPSDFKR